MKLKTICTIACCFLASALLTSKIAVAQEGGFRQPAPEKQVTITAIPGRRSPMEARLAGF
jgi:hypothetical protein